MKERNISLENDLMMLGQEPMDEPDSSTTIELQEIVKKTERKMLNPPAPPLKFEPKTADKSTENTDETASKTSEKTTSTVNKTAPKAYKPATRKTNKTAPPTPTPTNPHQPVRARRIRLQRQMASTVDGNRRHWNSRGGNRIVGRSENMLAVHRRRRIDRIRHAPALRLVRRTRTGHGGQGSRKGLRDSYSANKRRQWTRGSALHVPAESNRRSRYGLLWSWLGMVAERGRQEDCRTKAAGEKNDTQHGKAARFPAFFFNGVWQGLKTALVPHACISDPLPPMPTVRDWLQAHGGTGMDADAFDRCESEWYELLEQRKRQMNVFLAGLFVGTLVYAIAALALLALVGWLVYSLVPFDGFGRLVDWVRG